MDKEQREELIAMLRKNRSKHGVGHGMVYWNSVVDTVEKFLDEHFLEEVIPKE